MDARKIQGEFLAIYRDDLAHERVRPLADYQAMFRGHDSAIAAEYALLEEDEHGDAVTGDEAPSGAAEIDRYRILRELGRGGQAVVYLAHDPRLGRDVALKVLETSRLGLGAGTRIARLRREAELTARLDHPGICQVFDVGEVVERGLAYIAMRRVEGQTLALLIALSADRHSSSSAVSLPRSGDSDDPPAAEQPGGRTIERRSVHRVIELVEKAARALHVAHESGLIHRDVKPGNIMVTDDGEPVVLDFGLAREESSAADSLTVSGDVKA